MVECQHIVIGVGKARGKCGMIEYFNKETDPYIGIAISGSSGIGIHSTYRGVF